MTKEKLNIERVDANEHQQNKTKEQPPRYGIVADMLKELGLKEHSNASRNDAKENVMMAETFAEMLPHEDWGAFIEEFVAMRSTASNQAFHPHAKMAYQCGGCDSKWIYNKIAAKTFSNWCDKCQKITEQKYME